MSLMATYDAGWSAPPTANSPVFLSCDHDEIHHPSGHETIAPVRVSMRALNQRLAAVGRLLVAGKRTRLSSPSPSDSKRTSVVCDLTSAINPVDPSSPTAQSVLWIPSADEMAKRRQARLKRWTSETMPLTPEFASLREDAQ